MTDITTYTPLRTIVGYILDELDKSVGDEDTIMRIQKQFTIRVGRESCHHRTYRGMGIQPRKCFFARYQNYKFMRRLFTVKILDVSLRRQKISYEKRYCNPLRDSPVTPANYAR